MPKNYEPRPDCATVGVDMAAGPDVSVWWIELSADATIVELALLNAGMGCKLRAEHQGEGVFRLYPIEPGHPAPTGEQLRDILTAEHAHLPQLWAWQQ